MEKVKVLIIGSGPAGYTAAIYTSRANLQPVLYEGIEPGGQLTTTTEIENFPGYPEGVDGNQMMADLRRQAERFGTEIRTGQITKIDLSARPFHVTVDGTTELEAEAVIVATGASAKYLGLPSETKFRGQGVSACATCDGFFYRKKDVAVVGGGDTACEEATYLASLCRKVYMIVRKPYLRASKAMQERVFRTENIEVLFEHNTAEVLGDDSGVTGALLRRNDGEERTIDISGFFLAIGHHPNTELFAGQLELDAEGYIRTEPGTSKTSVEGVFAAGDVKDPPLPPGHHRRRFGLHRRTRLRTLPAAIKTPKNGSMKHIPILASILSAACALSSCAVETTYIGKAYPATDNPELFFSWNDVPGDYETMGHITAAPQFFGNLEDAQKAIEKRARERGPTPWYSKASDSRYPTRPTRPPSTSRRTATAAAPAPPQPGAMLR